MKAVVKYGYGDGDVELREVHDPAPGPEEVLVEVKAAGICGTDMDLYHNRQTYHVDVPVILGHEFTGVVVAVGDRVNGWSVGDRIVSETAAYVCGECVFCRSGSYNFCPSRKGFGYGVDGAFARYVRVRPEILHRIPDILAFDDAVLVEPLTVTVNALLEDTRIYPADTVAIIGPGAIGLLSVLVAKVAGASDVVVVGRSRHAARLALARELGATATVDSEREDLADAFKKIGDGLGAHLVIDVTGASETLDQALDIVRRNGQITEIGFGAKPLGFSLARLVSKAVRLQGVYSHTYRSWERAIRLISTGQVDPRPLVGGYYALTDWKQAIEDADSGRVIKAVVRPYE